MWAEYTKSSNTIVVFSAFSYKNSAFLSEPVIGKLFIRAKKGMVLYRVGLNSHEEIDTIYSDSLGYEVNLSADLAKPWLVLK